MYIRDKTTTFLNKPGGFHCFDTGGFHWVDGTPDDLASAQIAWRSEEFLEDKSMAVAAAACQALGKLGAAPYLRSAMSPVAMVKPPSGATLKMRDKRF